MNFVHPTPQGSWPAAPTHAHALAPAPARPPGIVPTPAQPAYPGQAQPVTDAAVSAARLGLTMPVGPQLSPGQFVAPGTTLHSLVAYGMGAMAILVALISTLGVALFVFALAPVLEWLFRRQIYARVLGSSVRVSREQLPEIHQAATIIAQRLGLQHLPEVFILETNAINAIATRIAGRKLVILTDDMVDACLRSGDVGTLNFVLAHELAHHALGHTGFIRSYVSQVYAPLGRVDELSADRLATAIVGHPDSAANALITLVCGPQLLRFVNRQALIEQAIELARNKVAKRAERPLRHPLLLRRIAHVYGQG